MSEASRATFVLHGDLVDLLPTGSRNAAPATLEHAISGRPAVKDVLEALGIPHPEVGALTVNGAPAELGRLLANEDRVEAWPADEASRLGLPPVVPPAPEDAAAPCFVLDGHLGRLAAYLRMLGFDTWYRHDADDDTLAAVAAAERRILLSRDRGLLKRSIVRRGALVRSDRPVEQLLEIARRYRLVASWLPFGRCLRCNALLVAAVREEIMDRLRPLTRIHYDEFRRCPGCDAVYWKGSHHARMTRLVERVREAAADPGDRSGQARSRAGQHGVAAAFDRPAVVPDS